MDDTKKVFSSEIIRNDDHYKNNLHDLLDIVPAKPLEVRERKKYTCQFIPRVDKVYVPKRKPGMKVKTVRDIRILYEKDTYSYLTSELESQQNYLLKKIRGGSARNENTIKIAKKLLRSNNPISRQTWQMLINLNPEDYVHPRQFVVWNGKNIQVNGSRGGNRKLICNFDLCKTKLSFKKKTNPIKTGGINKKRGLLQNSLAVKFKPGPLAKKMYLDDSHQKYNGNIELIDLPKVGLIIEPAYGTPLEPTLTQFLGDLRKDDGTMSAKWAEFATSVLGKIKNSNVKLLDRNNLTFDLKYKCDQHRLLMRKDSDKSYSPKILNTPVINVRLPIHQVPILPEVKEMMTHILDAVDISLLQDKLFTVDEKPLEDIKAVVTNTNNFTSASKDKVKRRYCELDRLDVTVITLPEASKVKYTENCGNMHCSLGCICDSLKGSFNFRQHCGREECIFDCKCDFSKYTSIKSLQVENDILPGIINIEDKINMRLAKEEQKFHQTVIVTGEDNILLKSEKRNWKASKKYANFYKNLCLKNVQHKTTRELAVRAVKLNCKNIEPFCMVHNLYKCFCKGMFRENTLNQDLNKESKQLVPKDTIANVECSSDQLHKDIDNDDLHIRKSLRPRLSQEAKSLGVPASNLPKNKTLTVADVLKTYRITTRNSVSDQSDSSTEKNCESAASETSDLSDYHPYSTCSRVKQYEGRKYNDEHYKTINIKIKELEQNDKKLQERMFNRFKLNVNDAKNQNKTVEMEKVYIKKKAVEKTDISLEKKVEETVNVSLAKKSEKTVKISLEIPVTETLNDSSLVKCLSDVNPPTSDSDKTKPLSPRALSTENKLVGWLESNYKLYKKRIDEGLFKTTLEAPKAGRVALHSWDFILSRYRERKNFFMISKTKPYRIFMGVHVKIPFFDSCININEIRFADLHKYPQTVKNLLTNATNLKDNFCILRGLSHCWELIGSVTKVNKSDENCLESTEEMTTLESNLLSSPRDFFEEQTSFDCEDQISIQTLPVPLNEKETSLESTKEYDSSKWFVMTVENDFSEIRFYKKGFFVKYESIVKAISVARLSAKTVRLSSHICADKSSNPQFGVYAIPNANEDCVFIGPYELGDSLGIETIKSISDVKRLRKTRGFWINTSKVDNLKVIDNPLSFMPLTSSKNNEAVPLESHCPEDKASNNEDLVGNSSPNEIAAESPTKHIMLNESAKKVVKPIYIRKTNGFYHLANDGLLKKIRLQSPPMAAPGVPSISNFDNCAGHFKNITALLTPDNEINDDTQIKITSVFSQKGDTEISKKNEKGMSILKPEEINRKIIQGKIYAEFETPNATISDVDETTSESNTMECLIFEDSKEISAVLTPCTVHTDICVISDDDDDASAVIEPMIFEPESSKRWKDVFLECTNVTDLGWVLAKQMSDTFALSIKIPGGEYSDFYPEEDAFHMLNSELSAIINPSKPFNLKWRVIYSLCKENITEMAPEVLHRVFASTSTATLTKNMKTYTRQKAGTPTPPSTTFTSLIDVSEVEQSDSSDENL